MNNMVLITANKIYIIKRETHTPTPRKNKQVIRKQYLCGVLRGY